MKKIYLLLLISVMSLSNYAQWTQLGADIQGVAELDEAGYGVSMNGDGSIVAVSAYLNDLGGNNAGQIRIFQLDDGNWVQMGQDIYGENSGDLTREVSLSDNGMRVAVGGQLNDDSGTEAGNVRVFEFTGETWTQLGSDLDGENEYDWFGSSVSLSGDGQRVAVGAHKNDGNGEDAGHARVFEYNDGDWIQLGVDLDGEAAGDSFGHSVCLDFSGNRLAVGGYLNSGGGSGSGHVRVFDYGLDSWNQIGADIDGDAAEDNSGVSVGINYNGSIVAVGAYRNNGNGFDSGQVRVFRFELGSWVQLGSDIYGSDFLNYFGLRLAISNDGYRFIAGSPPNDDNGTNSGNARVFSYPSPCTSSSNSISIIECESYTVPSGHETYSEAGSYEVLDTIPNVGGCDSLLTISLTINSSSTGIDSRTECNAFTWIDGNTYTSNTNTPTWIIPNSAGCDSLVTLELTISNSSTGTDTQTACDSFTWIDGSTFTSSTNTPTWALTNAAGCDSLVTLDLTVNYSNSGTDVQTTCDAYTWIDGNTYTSNNNLATWALTNALGCDSIVTLDLTINAVSSSVTQNGTLLTADEIGATYQWLNCAEMIPINGATDQSYTATESGDYAVIVDNNGCSETSECVTVIVVGIIESDFGSELLIYPNPTKGNFTIDLGENTPSVSVTITDLRGKVLYSNSFNNSQILNSTLDEPAGIYLLQIESGEKKAVIRLVIE